MRPPSHQPQASPHQRLQVLDLAQQVVVHLSAAAAATCTCCTCCTCRLRLLKLGLQLLHLCGTAHPSIMRSAACTQRGLSADAGSLSMLMHAGLRIGVVQQHNDAVPALVQLPLAPTCCSSCSFSCCSAAASEALSAAARSVCSWARSVSSCRAAQHGTVSSERVKKTEAASQACMSECPCSGRTSGYVLRCIGVHHDTILLFANGMYAQPGPGPTSPSSSCCLLLAVVTSAALVSALLCSCSTSA